MEAARIDALISGSLIVLAGSAVALWMPGGLATMLVFLMLMRICWLDENIRTDLMTATRVPRGYRQTQRMQTRLRLALFGTAPEEIACPRRLASRMRVQAHALHAMVLGAVAAAIAARGADAPVAALSLGGLCLVCAARRVDRLAEAEAILARRASLPADLLDDRGLLARFMRNGMSDR